MKHAITPKVARAFAAVADAIQGLSLPDRRRVLAAITVASEGEAPIAKVRRPSTSKRPRKR